MVTDEIAIMSITTILLIVVVKLWPNFKHLHGIIGFGNLWVGVTCIAAHNEFLSFFLVLMAFDTLLMVVSISTNQRR